MKIPAIAFPEIDRQTNERHSNNSGITIVVSPLIALMKDQVDALKRKGVAAECMDSTKTWDEIQQINKDLREGQLRLLYCAPERLNNEGFVETMKRVKGGVRLIGVDEAHCISEVRGSSSQFVQIADGQLVGTLFSSRLPQRFLPLHSPYYSKHTDLGQLHDLFKRLKQSASYA